MTDWGVSAPRGCGGQRRPQHSEPRCSPDAGGSVTTLVERVCGEGAHLCPAHDKAHHAGGWGRPRVCGDMRAVTRGREACGWAWARAGGPGHCSVLPSILTVYTLSMLSVIRCFPQDFKKEMGDLSFTEAQMSHIN